MTSKPYKNYDLEQPWLPFSEVLMDWDNDFHELMLQDAVRMHAYETAIKAVVKPGDVVLDLGTGTGILSRWALEAGAGKVYGIDLNAEVLRIAEENLASLGFSDRFVPLCGLSFDIELDEKVDVIISEILGNMGDNENFQNILHDAITRFLKPSGRRIPFDTCSFVAPIESERAHCSISDGDIQTINDSYDVARFWKDKSISSPFNMYYDTVIPKRCNLSEPQELRLYQGKWNQSSVYNERRTFVADRIGVLDGFRVHFVARLSSNVVLDISGDDLPARTASDSWKHAFLPIEKPLLIEQGDHITLVFSRFYRGAESHQENGFKQVYQWRGQVRRGKKLIGSFNQCTNEAVLLEQDSQNNTVDQVEYCDE